MIEMQPVKECNVVQCAYNRENCCRALAITVGDQEPLCDTFWTYSNKAGDPTRAGGVGACKVINCVHNYDGECGSPLGIAVGNKGSKATCLTFSSR